MSLYGDYLKERTNDQIYETTQGFATYRFIDDKTIYIIDIYVKPENRRSRVGSDIADYIVGLAKIRGCTKLIGTVVPSTKGATASLQGLLAYGMTLESCANDVIILKKDI